jgi:hypothetical protein
MLAEWMGQDFFIIVTKQKAPLTIKSAGPLISIINRRAMSIRLRQECALRSFGYEAGRAAGTLHRSQAR